MSLAASGLLATTLDEQHNPVHDHVQKRFFIGPMPEKVVNDSAQAQFGKKKARRRFSSDDDDEIVAQAIKDHAFSFFLFEGGNVDDWGDEEERGVRERMMLKWKDSDWGKVLRRQKEKPNKVGGSHWVGSSFEIGNLLGMNFLNRSCADLGSNRDGASNLPAPSLNLSLERRRPAPTRPAGGSVGIILSPPFEMGNSNPEGGLRLDNDISSPTSATGLLRPLANNSRVRSEIQLRPLLKKPTGPQSEAQLDGFSDPAYTGKGKRKLVHYSDGSLEPEEPENPPAPPSEVLERTGEAIEATSAGAAISSSKDDTQWGDVVMRDRMLVRVCRAASDDIGSSFDELKNQTSRGIKYEPWSEYMVAWRKDRIELYEDYGSQITEWFLKHKRLAFVIPLKATKTRLSLYSFVDLTFCIACEPTPLNGGSPKPLWLFNRDPGLNIFLLKVKARSRALDWMWLLWRHMGGQLPPYIEVRNPGLDVRVTVDIPNPENMASDEDFLPFTRENIVEKCKKALATAPNWKELMERQLRTGKSLQLAWRTGANLDWISYDEDVEGVRRNWAVLCGLALRPSGRPAQLEIRLGEHYPRSLRLPDGSRLEEPAPIEGYLDRIRPNFQTKQLVYLCTHDGNLFSLSPTQAHPPSPPGIKPVSSSSADYVTDMRHSEVKRGALQIMGAIGVSDLRSILAVRRAFHATAQHSHTETDPNDSRNKQGTQEWMSAWAQGEPERTDSDDEDGGGEEAVSKASDKPRIRMKRSFELLLNSGHVVRFEAHSRSVALEWINRLRALILYWNQRHRIDAREEMDVAQARRPRLTPHMHAHLDDNALPPEPPTDLGSTLPGLATLYNWCVLENCRSIVKGGKIFARGGLNGQYQLSFHPKYQCRSIGLFAQIGDRSVQMFLVSGCLVQFHITPKSLLYRRKAKRISLLDAYVCSGYFAALTLPNGQFDPNSTPTPRRYQDGLEADDPEEDLLFVIWYWPEANKGKIDKNPSDGPKISTKVPELSAKRQTVVFRTRSKLERDAWCWALNAEIERLTRSTKDREGKLRETGGLTG